MLRNEELALLLIDKRRLRTSHLTAECNLLFLNLAIYNARVSVGTRIRIG